MPAVIENDATKTLAKPAVIVAAIRSGGTFLAHCLSNHPDIYCDRGEPLHHRSVWCQGLGIADRRPLLATLLKQHGYRVSMVKLTYMQAFHADIWPWLCKRRPHVIWLCRENLIRQAVSVAINQQARAGLIDRPQHSFEVADEVQITIEPALFLRYLQGLERENLLARERLQALPQVLSLTYEEITASGGVQSSRSAKRLNPEAGRRICGFLGMRTASMPTDLVRINQGPLSDMLSNLREVQEALDGSAYAEMAEREEWTS